MSIVKKRTGYSISATAVFVAAVMLIDRYPEYATGAEGLISWALVPAILAVLAVTSVALVGLGHASESENDA